MKQSEGVGSQRACACGRRVEVLYNARTGFMLAVGSSVQMKKIRYRIKCDWDILENKPELEILKKYAEANGIIKSTYTMQQSDDIHSIYLPWYEPSQERKNERKEGRKEDLKKEQKKDSKRRESRNEKLKKPGGTQEEKPDANSRKPRKPSNQS
uniref:Uncharacterized protein n=1 Tax=Vespula pensylvanica TaxID=30213 RepID=A0A834JID1_VESPE|nr:hypothetical protein H0235_018424 [Vespula pensylvanica]